MNHITKSLLPHSKNLHSPYWTSYLNHKIKRNSVPRDLYVTPVFSWWEKDTTSCCLRIIIISTMINAVITEQNILFFMSSIVLVKKVKNITKLFISHYKNYKTYMLFISTIFYLEYYILRYPPLPLVLKVKMWLPSRSSTVIMSTRYVMFL